MNGQQVHKKLGVSLCRDQLPPKGCVRKTTIAAMGVDSLNKFSNGVHKFQCIALQHIVTHLLLIKTKHDQRHKLFFFKTNIKHQSINTAIT